MLIQLPTDLTAAHARIAQLEAQIEALTAKVKSAPKPRVARSKTPPTGRCQYCDDTKVEKMTFLGLPMCKGDGCGSRIRRNAKSGALAFAYDKRFSTRLERVDGVVFWVARFGDTEITRNTDRVIARRAACAARDLLVGNTTTTTTVEELAA